MISCQTLPQRVGLGSSKRPKRSGKMAPASPLKTSREDLVFASGRGRLNRWGRQRGMAIETEASDGGLMGTEDQHSICGELDNRSRRIFGGSSEVAAYLSFWGKSGGASSGQPAWHPVAHHSLDVAAVAEALLDLNPRRRPLWPRCSARLTKTRSAFSSVPWLCTTLASFRATFRRNVRICGPKRLVRSLVTGGHLRQ